MSPMEKKAMQGIVDKVRAVRNSSEEVLYLEVTIRVTFPDVKGRYGDTVTSDIVIPMPVSTEVNPGHAAAIDMVFMDPFGQRFKPALEVSNDEEAVDVDA